MSINAWKPVIVQKLVIFPLAPLSCYHTQAKFDIQLLKLSSVRDKSAKNYNKDKFSNIIFQIVC